MDKSYITQSIDITRNISNISSKSPNIHEMKCKIFGSESKRSKALKEAKEMINTLNEYERIFENATHSLYSMDGIHLNESENCHDDYISSEIYEQLGEALNSEYLYESIKDVVKNAKYKYKKKEESVDRAVADRIRKMNDEIKNDIRDKYVERIPFKLSKIIKTAIAAGAVWAINPAIAAVGAVVAFARSKAINAREKDRLISEIREERTIVEEKIKDADSNGDKKEKYDLMRLKISLDRAEQRLIRS